MSKAFLTIFVTILPGLYDIQIIFPLLFFSSQILASSSTPERSICCRLTFITEVTNKYRIIPEIPDLFDYFERHITFNTRNKSGISKHICIVLFII